MSVQGKISCLIYFLEKRRKMCSASRVRKCNEIYQLNHLGKMQFEIPLNKKNPQKYWCLGNNVFYE